MDRPDAAIDAIPEQVAAWKNAGKGAAIATVLRTWGSAPRQAGAQLGVSSEAEITGSVSGGCVESAVTAEAMEAMEDGRPRIVEYGVSDDDAFAVGLACGGTIRILVDPVGVGQGMSREDLDRIVAARAEREALGYGIDTTSWTRRFMTPAEAPQAFAADKSGFLDEGETQFLTVMNPPLRLVIVGAAHIAQALSPMAQLAGYDVTVIDPRGAFATEARFPGLIDGKTLRADWPEEVMPGMALDARTAVVCLTHDPKIDDPALSAALPSEAFYVGALGSTRTHAKRVERLVGGGLAQAAMDRLHAPIGLDIGSKSPAEIAISILAQMTERLRRPETRPELRDSRRAGAA